MWNPMWTMGPKREAGHEGPSVAFSMYSRLPVPDFVWEEEDRKKAMCFFPLIGVRQGLHFSWYIFLWNGQGQGLF